MPLTNYGELKTEVASWLARADAKTLARIPDFIRMAEADMFQDLRCRENEFVQHYTPASLTDPWALPANYREMIAVLVDDVPLDPIDAASLLKRVAAGESGPPAAFAELERRLYLVPALPLVLADWPAGTRLTVWYYGDESLDALPTWQTPTNAVQAVGEEVDEATTLPSHGDTNTTRLFLRLPQLYLAGALHYGYAYLMNDKKRDYWGTKFQGGLDKLELENAEAALAGGVNLAGMAYGD